MEPRLDIIILGATGFTGTFTAKNLALICKEPEYAHLKWGIAGRSKEKLFALLTQMEEKDISMIECDIVKNVNTIMEVTKRTKLLMNATGPCTILSEPIVRACIATGTHYIDISAELYHMLNIYRGYNKAAEEANVLIVPTCGFACIPVVAGLTQLERNFKGTLHSVECYTVLDIPTRANFPFPGHNNSLIHYGTWESLVHELRNHKKYMQLKKLTLPESEPVPDELKKPFFHRSKGRFWYPYPGPDYAVIEQTQQYQSESGKTPYHFKMYTTMPLFIHFLVVVPVFFLYYILSAFACFRKLVWTFPRVFTLGLASHQGPSDKMRSDTKFSFTLNGKGWSDGTNLKMAPDRKLIVMVSGSDPGYTTTSICFIFAAITLLTERSKMPSGGVLPTGVAFNDTQIAEKLTKHGIAIDIISEYRENNLISA
ncbi:saccharopine dehydrogenase NADP binding domain-containing protein [Phthorimaea operculella]|nr:saccharopine dehydrogenase NADP binding domain-containing protein [Phthorimaea operculella]